MTIILVVGSPRCGKRSLLEVVVGSLGKAGKSSGDSRVAKEESSGGCVDETDTRNADREHVPHAVAPLRQEFIEEAEALFDVYPSSITTKYYSVQVEFWRQVKPMPVLALRCAQLEGLEGIIVMFDLSEENSFEEIERWTAFVDTKEACAFRLCVGSKVDLLGGSQQNDGSDSDGGAGVEKRRRQCLEWCLDNGFEYVEADCRDADRGGLGIMQGQVDTYPTFIEVCSFLAGNCDAIYHQLVHVARTSPDRARKFARQAAFEVAIKFCMHNEEVLRPLEGTARALRAASIVADGGYKGLYDLRQLAYGAAVALDYVRKGLQLYRAEWFMQAFRALFPSGEGSR